jgi:hypothetical protein
MSRAIKLTQTDIAYLKFGGAGKYREQLETMRVKQVPLSTNLFQAIPFEANVTRLFIGHETSPAYSQEQINTLNTLREAANEIGYSVEVSKLPADKNSATRVLLKHDRAFTFDDIFSKPPIETKELVYLKRKGYEK